MPAGVAGPAGNRRPRSPRPAAPRSASHTAWIATSPSEWPWRAGAPSIDDPAEGQRAARSEGVSVVAEADAEVGGGRCEVAARHQRRLDPGEVVGQRHLEVRRLTGDRMDRDSTGLEQRRLVGPGRGATPGGCSAQARARTSRRIPWGVWAAARVVRSTVAATRPPSIRLSVSATGTTGMAAPWDGRRRRDPPHERRRDERTGAVVHQEHVAGRSLAQRGDARGHRVLAPGAAGDDRRRRTAAAMPPRPRRRPGRRR